jgi:hypothetical protein
VPGATYQYDGASRIKTVDGGATATYAYDGDGRRARKVSGGQTRHYFYDPEGNAVFEHVAGIGWETFNLYINGRHPATNNATGAFTTYGLPYCCSPGSEERHPWNRQVDRDRARGS